MALKSKTLRRLGLIENWNWPLLWFVLPFYVLFTILYDAVLTGNASYLWIITFVGASLVEISFVAISKKLFLIRLLRRHPSGVIGGSFAGIVNVVRNCTVAFLALQLGLLQEVDWLTRILGAYFMGTALMVLYVSVLGSRVEHNASMSRLQSMQSSLVVQRQNSSSLLKAENDRLLDYAKTLLLPRIEKIEQLLRQNQAKSDTLQELRALVTEQVRPLSAELSSTAKSLAQKPAPELVKRIKTGFMAPRVNLRQVLKPGLVLFLSGLGQWFMVNMLAGAQQASITIVGVLAGWLILFLFKMLLPAHLTVTRGLAVVVLTSIAFVSGIPVALINLSLTSTPTDLALYSMLLISPILATIGFAISASLDAAREDAEQKIRRDNQSLARETALFDQRMWLAKRSWGFVVHGTVQAALTAAITRLSSAADLEQYQIDLVLQDLNRAKIALSKTPEVDVNLSAALNDLVSTWQGICDVEWVCTGRADRAISRDANTRMCVNEIAKEAVSNAVRHGEAKNVWIEIDRSSDELLLVTVSNNGRAVPANFVPGVGSQMLDGLTLDWSLTFNRALGRTVMQAQVPISGVMAGQI